MQEFFYFCPNNFLGAHALFSELFYLPFMVVKKSGISWKRLILPRQQILANWKGGD